MMAGGDAGLGSTLLQVGAHAAGLLQDSGFWIVLSLVAGGLVHEFMDTGRVQRAMRGMGAASIPAGTLLGAMLPLCSCGVVPLAASFHLAGVRVATVIAFTIATPVINPAAVVLCWALLGPELTLAYVAFGLGAPIVVGYLAEKWGDRRLDAVVEQLKSCCCPGPATRTAAEPPGRRLGRAMRWGFLELGPMLGFYLAIGIVLAALLSALIPPGWVQGYLGSDMPFVSLLVVAAFGATIYVCAVAHIPLVAAMLAAGASPGSAIVFLVTGAATNLPEIIALARVLGRRTVAVYVGGVVLLSIATGWMVNLWLVGYEPVLDPLASLELADVASRLTPVVPSWAASTCALVVAALAAWGIGQRVARLAARSRGPAVRPERGVI